ncbi:hypothetical protein SAMN06269185_3096 [Natronoarchaeum philippinense]|uniref:Uncharacterized protein n=1 Tax=Natronoarchaeum philippinense TaxID=558529 RepID=A0A285P8X9_NATPI|nr:hypothetical protein [Natronoarchaeum philippinense]SNZ17707.1 hypothetical protein SAMN06269185_3096 [Natronoarchaeum philippinense]
MSDATASQASAVASEETPAAGGSRWWYLIAAVPVVYTLTLALAPMFTLSVVVGQPIPTAGVFLSPKVTILVLGTPAFLVTLSLPLALHQDLRSLPLDAADWSPDREAWALLGAVGLFVPGYAPVVASYYLYRRFRSVG